MNKWNVRQTKSKLRWVAWRIKSKKKSGIVFDSWIVAIRYAYLMSKVDFIIEQTKAKQ